MEEVYKSERTPRRKFVVTVSIYLIDARTRMNYSQNLHKLYKITFARCVMYSFYSRLASFSYAVKPAVNETWI
jgi:hypothetical protein